MSAASAASAITTACRYCVQAEVPIGGCPGGAGGAVGITAGPFSPVSAVSAHVMKMPRWLWRIVPRRISIPDACSAGVSFRSLPENWRRRRGVGKEASRDEATVRWVAVTGQPRALQGSAANCWFRYGDPCITPASMMQGSPCQMHLTNLPQSKLKKAAPAPLASQDTPCGCRSLRLPEAAAPRSDERQSGHHEFAWTCCAIRSHRPRCVGPTQADDIGLRASVSTTR